MCMYARARARACMHVCAHAVEAASASRLATAAAAPSSPLKSGGWGGDSPGATEREAAALVIAPMDTA